LFQGSDANGLVAEAGSFTADGNGNITAGLADINRVSGVTTSAAFTGTYSIGADDRGTLVLNFGATLGISTFRVALGNLSAQGVSSKARMIEFDATGTNGGGVIELQ